MAELKFWRQPENSSSPLKMINEPTKPSINYVTPCASDTGCSSNSGSCGGLCGNSEQESTISEADIQALDKNMQNSHVYRR